MDGLSIMFYFPGVIASIALGLNIVLSTFGHIDLQTFDFHFSFAIASCALCLNIFRCRFFDIDRYYRSWSKYYTLYISGGLPMDHLNGLKMLPLFFRCDRQHSSRSEHVAAFIFQV